MVDILCTKSVDHASSHVHVPTRKTVVAFLIDLFPNAILWLSCHQTPIRRRRLHHRNCDKRRNRARKHSRYIVFVFGNSVYFMRIKYCVDSMTY